MTNIITGGAGFVGSHLVDVLTAKGQECVIVDNYSRGSMANLYDAQQTKLLRFRPLNLETNGLSIRATDVVWHLAAKVASISYNRKNQYEMLRSNLIINHNVIDAVRKQKPRLFVYVSTACVYPHDAPIPTPESAGNIGNPEPTNHGYGVAKWVGEQMVKHLYKEHNVPCIIVRLNNVIGLRDYYDKQTSHVVPALIRRVMEGEDPLIVWGSGQQSRVFVDARDVAKALVKLSETREAHDAQPINIGHDREVTIAQLTEVIVKACGKDVGYVFDTSKPDGHKRRLPDVSRLKGLIGWVPDTPLETTIADMVQEFAEGKSHA